jgi:hypothetical protein
LRASRSRNLRASFLSIARVNGLYPWQSEPNVFCK